MTINTASQDILKRFPYEIWSKCILDAIYRAPEGPLPFLGVSSHWQTTLLGSPEMWSYIHIDNGEDLNARVHTFLALSGSYSLEFAVAFTRPIWLPMKPVIAAHKGRIRFLHVLRWPPSRQLENARIPVFLEGITFPAVQTITTSNSSLPGTVFEYLMDLCPNLEYVGVPIFYTRDQDRKRVPERLRGAHIGSHNTSIESLVSQLQPYLHLKRLEYLSLSMYSPPFLTRPILETVAPNGFTLSSTRLRELVISVFSRAVLQGIFGSSLEHLQFLGICILPRNFDILISALPAFLSLQSIQLSFIFEEDIPSGFSRLHQSHIPYVRKFAIQIISESQVMLDAVFDSLTDQDALVNIEEFVFTCSYPPYGALHVANLEKLCYSLRNCTDIELPALKDDETTAEMNNSIIGRSIHMPNLLHLTITCSTPLPPVTAPSLKSLKVLYPLLLITAPLNHFGRSTENSDLTGEVFENFNLSPFNPWETAQHVEWGSCKSFVAQKTTAFRYIRSVEFLGLNVKVYDHMHALNTFLVLLLRYHDLCPRLRFIKSAIHPVWQLLSQALLQRNETRNIDRLQEIWLPYLPIRPLLAPVVALLKGKASSTPRYVDDMILRRFKYELIRACRHCITAGYTKCRVSFRGVPSEPWLVRMEDGSMHDRRSDAEYLELLEQPSNMSSMSAPDSDLKLSWKEWDERLREMTEDCKRTSRPWSCIKDGKLVRIHKYMLHN